MARHSSIIAPSLGRGVRAAFAMMDGVLARRDNPLGGGTQWRGKGDAALGNATSLARNLQNANAIEERFSSPNGPLSEPRAERRCRGTSTARQEGDNELGTLFEIVFFFCPFVIEPHLTSALR